MATTEPSSCNVVNLPLPPPPPPPQFAFEVKHLSESLDTWGPGFVRYTDTIDGKEKITCWICYGASLNGGSGAKTLNRRVHRRTLEHLRGLAQQWLISDESYVPLAQVFTSYKPYWTCTICGYSAMTKRDLKTHCDELECPFDEAAESGWLRGIRTVYDAECEQAHDIFDDTGEKVWYASVYGDDQEENGGHSVQQQVAGVGSAANPRAERASAAQRESHPPRGHRHGAQIGRASQPGSQTKAPKDSTATGEPRSADSSRSPRSHTRDSTTDTAQLPAELDGGRLFRVSRRSAIAAYPTPSLDASSTFEDRFDDDVDSKDGLNGSNNGSDDGVVEDDSDCIPRSTTEYAPSAKPTYIPGRRRAYPTDADDNFDFEALIKNKRQRTRLAEVDYTSSVDDDRSGDDDNTSGGDQDEDEDRPEETRCQKTSDASRAATGALSTGRDIYSVLGRVADAPAPVPSLSGAICPSDSLAHQGTGSNHGPPEAEFTVTFNVHGDSNASTTARPRQSSKVPALPLPREILHLPTPPPDFQSQVLDRIPPPPRKLLRASVARHDSASPQVAQSDRDLVFATVALLKLKGLTSEERFAKWFFRLYAANDPEAVSVMKRYKMATLDDEVSVADPAPIAATVVGDSLDASARHRAH